MVLKCDKCGCPINYRKALLRASKALKVTASEPRSTVLCACGKWVALNAEQRKELGLKPW